MSFLKQRGKKKIWTWIRYEKGKKVFESLHTKDRKIAEYLAGKRAEEIRLTGLPAAFRIIQIRSCLLAYLRDCRGRVSRKLYLDRKRMLILLFREMRIKTIRDIATANCSDVLNSLKRSKSWQPRTFNEYRMVLHTFCNWCVHRGWIAGNPMARIKPMRVLTHPVTYLTNEDIQKLLGIFQGHHYGPAIATAIFAGLRFSELKHLEWQDVDFHSKTITVRNKAGFQTKTGKFRIVPMSSRLIDILSKQPNGTERCFKALNHNSLCKTMKQYRKQHEIPKAWNFLTFRHTFATHCAQAGISPWKLREWMGHSDVRITGKYYVGAKQGYDADIEKVG